MDGVLSVDGSLLRRTEKVGSKVCIKHKLAQRTSLELRMRICMAAYARGLIDHVGSHAASERVSGGQRSGGQKRQNVDTIEAAWV